MIWWFKSNWSMFCATQYDNYNPANGSVYNSFSKGKVSLANDSTNHQSHRCSKPNSQDKYFRYHENAYHLLGIRYWTNHLKVLCKNSNFSQTSNLGANNVLKVSIFRVFLVRIFPDSDWIRTRKTPNTVTFYAVKMI